MPDLLESRGYFWWGSETIPAGHWAPNGMLSGHLSINEDGLASLTLDAPLPRDNPAGHLAIALEQELPEDVIAGVLSGGQHVRLTRLVKNGGNFAVSGPSHERFLALQCLIGPEPFPSGVEPFYRTLICPLVGYEDWLRLESIAVELSAAEVTATYTAPADLHWQVGELRAQLSYRFRSGMDPRVAALEWTQSAELRLTDEPRDVDALIKLASRLEDFFILITDSERGLDFPLLTGQSASRVQLYFARNTRKAAPVDWSSAWVSFAEITKDFGHLLHAWFAAHEQFGPGFHLYLGNRRGVTTYPEFRFASFIWGLESMHRLLHQPQPNSSLEAKVTRILGGIERPKDRKWVAGKLATVEEPALSTRLSQVLRCLPIGLKEEELEEFVQRCNRRRNDISHFGGARNGQGYDEFLVDIVTLNRALNLLYHARILLEAGLSKQLIWAWFIEGRRSYFIKNALAAAGLNLPASGTVSPYIEP